MSARDRILATLGVWLTSAAAGESAWFELDFDLWTPEKHLARRLRTPPPAWFQALDRHLDSV